MVDLLVGTVVGGRLSGKRHRQVALVIWVNQETGCPIVSSIWGFVRDHFIHM